MILVYLLTIQLVYSIDYESTIALLQPKLLWTFRQQACVSGIAYEDTEGSFPFNTSAASCPSYNESGYHFPASNVGVSLNNPKERYQVFTPPEQARFNPWNNTKSISVAMWLTTTGIQNYLGQLYPTSYLFEIGPPTGTESGVKGDDEYFNKFQVRTSTASTTRLLSIMIAGSEYQTFRTCITAPLHSGVLFDLMNSSGKTYLFVVAMDEEGLDCYLAEASQVQSEETTHIPSYAPTKSPSILPTYQPSTLHPTTLNPTTRNPTTKAPTKLPTVTRAPSSKSPTLIPTTWSPSLNPTLNPTVEPTTIPPTRIPTTLQPSLLPTLHPSASPLQGSSYPTKLPSAPTRMFTQAPSPFSFNPPLNNIVLVHPLVNSSIRIGTSQSVASFRPFAFTAQYHMLAMFDYRLSFDDVQSLYNSGLPNSVPAVNSERLLLTLNEDEEDVLVWDSLFHYPFVYDYDHDPIQAIQVVSLPHHGQLIYNSTKLPVHVGDIISSEEPFFFRQAVPNNFSSVTCTPPVLPLTSFQFKASDGFGWSVNSATVDLCIRNVNDPPFIDQNLTFTVYSFTQTPVSIPVFDIDSSLSYNALVVDYSSEIVPLSPSCQGGSLVARGFTITSVSSNIQFCIQSLQDVESTSWLSIRLSDGTTPNPQLFNITVQVIFSIQVCGGSPCSVSTEEDVPKTFSIESTDYLNRGATIIEILEPPKKGTLVGLGFGLFRYSPYLHENRDDYFIFRARVGSTPGPNVTHSIYITPQFDIPTLTVSPNAAICSSEMTSFQVTLLDPDFDEFPLGIKFTVSNPALGVRLLLSPGNLEFLSCAGLSQTGLCSSLWAVGLPRDLNQSLSTFALKCTDPNLVSGRSGLSIEVFKGNLASSPLLTRSVSFTTPITTSPDAEYAVTLAMWILIGAISGALAILCFLTTCAVFACSRLGVLSVRLDKVLTL